MVQIQKDTIAKNIPCQLVNLSDEAKGIFRVVNEDALIDVPFKPEKSQDGFNYHLMERRRFTFKSEKTMMILYVKLGNHLWILPVILSILLRLSVNYDCHFLYYKTS